MNSLGISTDPTLLSVDLPSSLTTSPSVSTFLPEEEASICPLLPATTPSPPPLDYIHPLTPSTGADSGNVNTESARDCGDENGDRANAEDTSSSSSGIGIEVNGGPNSIFTKNAYQHLACNLMENMNGHQDDGKKQNGFRGLNRLNISISQETPTFVAWNWPVIRKCTFFMVMSALFAMTALVVSMIVTLPKACNPPVPWWKGSVFYEIFPASFQDSNADGLGDIKGLASRVDYIKNLGVGAIRLNSIFPAKHYPDYFQNVTTLMEIDDVLGTKQDLQQLIATLHANNISLILDLPLYPLIKDLAATDLTSNSTLFNATMDSEDISHSVESNVITDAMRMWLALGVDGFYVKGLEHFEDDPYLLDNVKEWRQLLGADRILIISNNLVKKMDTEAAREVLDQVNLVDVFLDVSNGSAYIASQIKHTIEGILKPGFAPWLQWSLGGVSERRLANGVSQNASLAASLMQLMLPGTPSIFYGDEINLSETHDPHNEHSETKHMHHLATMEWSHGNQFTNRDTLPWLPRGANSVAFHHVDLIQELIKLRERTPSIYQNAVYKSGVDPIPSTSVRYSRNDILILERWYPRRNTFVSISNLGDKILSLNLSAMFYSGVAVVTKSPITDIYFSAFEIGPMETIIVKLHK